MRNALLACFTYLVFAAVVLGWMPLMFVLFLLSAPFDPDRRFVGRLLRFASQVVVKTAPLWRLRIENLDKRPEGSFVLVANHESILDTLVLPGMPWEMKFVAKESIFRIPFVGWMMHLAGDIPLLRGDKDSGAKAMIRAKHYLDRGVPVIMFPEGTRSREPGVLRPFKLGAFKLAIAAQRPLMPVAIYGTRDGMPIGSPFIRPAIAVARILDPVPTAGLTEADAPRLAEELRARIGAAREELAAEVRRETAQREKRASDLEPERARAA